ncbi:rCG38191, partial [Rattus norvegicus]
MVASSGQLT